MELQKAIELTIYHMKYQMKYSEENEMAVPLHVRVVLLRFLTKSFKILAAHS